MKKLLGLLGLLVLVLVLASCGMSKSDHAEFHRIQAIEYELFCETDSVIVGYEYAFLFNDSIPMNYKVFNPEYLGLSSVDGNFVYADTSDLPTLRGYWLCVQQLDRGVPKMPQMSNEIKLTLKADWERFIKWRDGK